MLVDGTARAKQSTTALPAAPEPGAILGWFRKLMPPEFFDELKRDLQIVENSRIFTLPVTIWLMILQRLSPLGTLESAMEQLRQGSGRELLEPCKRVREERISPHTGGYGQARVNLPAAAARRVAERTFCSLCVAGMGEKLLDRCFVLDGSTIRLAHSRPTAAAYPAARNPRRPSHWPKLLVAVMHHVRTGTATAPVFGPMHGPERVSEQSLGQQLMDQLPSSSVVIGDRNFGIFSLLWYAHTQQHRVITRLSANRARPLAGGTEPVLDTDTPVIWKPSGHDRRKHPEIPAEACIQGRLIAVRPVGAKQNLYLFTTLDEPVDEIVALYGRRWNIETDLRSLKQQVRLQEINARSPNMIASELYIAVATWNLIRAVMHTAAQQAKVEPRRLSFSRARAALLAFTQAAAHHHSVAEQERGWQLMIQSIAACLLPTRHRPSAPRLVWPRPQTFAKRKVQRDG